MSDDQAVPLPDDAVTAAAGAIFDEAFNGPRQVDQGQWSNALARRALAAAAPHLYAAERERIRRRIIDRRGPYGETQALLKLLDGDTDE